MRGISPAGLIGIVLTAVVWDASPGIAQDASVRGMVVEAESGQPVPGAFVALIGPDATVQAAAFTRLTGEYTVATRTPGRYSLRVQRIGFESWTSEPFSLPPGQSRSMRLEIPVSPISLAAIDVRVSRTCLLDDDDGGALAMVWDEAHKALEQAAWAEQQGRIRFTVVGYERFQDGRTLASRDETSRRRTNVTLPPFVSPSAARLDSTGYVTTAGDTVVYYAPDARVLMSQQFRDRHCFRLEQREVDDARQIGIAFRPRERRGPDIAGVLWLDEVSGGLRELEYRYVHHPFPTGTDGRRVGGWLEFARVPNGPFYVRDWWIRMPVTGNTTLSLPRQMRGSSGVDRREVLAGYKQDGGTVEAVYLDGRPLYSRSGAALEGTVWDRVASAPLEGATIELIGEEGEPRLTIREARLGLTPEDRMESGGLSSVAAADGSFRLDGIPEGEYTIRIRHPRWEVLGYPLPDSTMSLTAGETARIEIRTPGSVRVWERLCAGGVPTRSVGILVGRVTDRIGSPVPAAEIRVRPPPGSDGHGDFRTDTDADGHFRLCRIPVAVPLQIAVGSGEAVEVDTTRLTRRVGHVELVLAPDPS